MQVEGLGGFSIMQNSIYSQTLPFTKSGRKIAIKWLLSVTLYIDKATKVESTNREEKLINLN